jgi:hypothetical protein
MEHGASSLSIARDHRITSNQTDDLRRLTRLEFLRESGSEGIEMIMLQIRPLA